MAVHPTEGSGDSGPLVVGRFYYNTADNLIYVYTSTGWAPLVLGTGPNLKKLVFPIGDGTNSTYTITHNLNTMDLVVTARSSASPYQIALIDMEFINTSNIRVSASRPLTLNELSVTVIG